MKKNTLIAILWMMVFGANGQPLPKQVSESDFTIGKTIKIESTILNKHTLINRGFSSTETR